MDIVSDTVERMQRLSDVELAILLSLLANQHCLIHTDAFSLSLLMEEVQQICSEVFRLSHIVLRCDESTTLDDFRESLLVDRQLVNDSLEGHGIDRSYTAKLNASRLSRSPPESSYDNSNSRPLLPGPNEETVKQIANVLVIEGLSLAKDDIQIQAFELLRTHRIFTRTAVYMAPSIFLVVFLKKTCDPRHVKHLNDYIFIAHRHNAEDSFSNPGGASRNLEDDQVSMTSVVHRSAGDNLSCRTSSYISADEIKKLSEICEDVVISAEIVEYQYNIITFLRLHRAVAGGISPRATRYFRQLLKCLSILHGSHFVTPSLVALAARKIYAHRIILATVDQERSMQYGSDRTAIENCLSRYNPDLIIDEVLREVDTPL